MSEPTILYYCLATEDTLNIIRSLVPAGFRFTHLQSGSKEERTCLLAEADYILVATEPVGEAEMQAAPRLRHVQHQGVGYNNIDIDAAQAHGISVAITSSGTAASVSEHTLLLILALYRHLLRADTDTRAGGWLQFGLRPISYNLEGKTLGLIGFGRVGRAVAKRARAFDAKIIFHDIVQPGNEIVRALDARSVTLDELLLQSDIVSLHVPLTKRTRSMIGAAQFALMRPHTIFINAARGEAVDEDALIEALRAGKIAGAGLDVFSDEPPQRDNPLLRMDNVVVTPHIAAGTLDTLIAKMQHSFANIMRAHRGELLHEQIV